MPKEKYIIDILLKWLEDNRFDGLVNPDYECGCKLDDIVPCESNFCSCMPAYNHGQKDGCAFYMSTEKPKCETEKAYKEEPLFDDCGYCGGQGYIIVDCSTDNEYVQDTQECPECSGSGRYHILK